VADAAKGFSDQKTMKLREVSKASKRRGILRAAQRLFAQKPYHDVLLEEVAAAARIGKGTVYLYFKSKEEMYLALLRENLEPLPGQLKLAVEKSASAWAALGAIIRRLLEFSDEHPALRQVLRVTTIESRETVVQEAHEQIVALVEQVLQDGVRRKEFAPCDAEITALLILGMISKLKMVCGHGASRPVDEVLPHMLRMVAGGLGVSGFERLHVQDQVSDGNVR
jgi:AcrR family transcriptional regulator